MVDREVPFFLSLCLAGNANSHWRFPWSVSHGAPEAMMTTGSWESSPGAEAAEKDLLHSVCMDTNSPFPQSSEDHSLNCHGVFVCDHRMRHEAVWLL